MIKRKLFCIFIFLLFMTGCMAEPKTPKPESKPESKSESKSELESKSESETKIKWEDEVSEG